MRNQKWTEWSLLLLTLVVGGAQAQTCTPALIPASTPTSQLQDNGDGTVTDLKTGLMWKQCAEGLSGSDCASGSLEKLTWSLSLQRAKDVNDGAGFAGHRDWRVPNIKELASLVELQCYSPAINLTRFPNTPSTSFSSSSAYAGNGDAGWYVAFDSGQVWGLVAKDRPFALRLVRGAP